MLPWAIVRCVKYNCKKNVCVVVLKYKHNIVGINKDAKSNSYLIGF